MDLFFFHKMARVWNSALMKWGQSLNVVFHIGLGWNCPFLLFHFFFGYKNSELYRHPCCLEFIVLEISVPMEKFGKRSVTARLREVSGVEGLPVVGCAAGDRSCSWSVQHMRSCIRNGEYFVEFLLWKIFLLIYKRKPPGDCYICDLSNIHLSKTLGY